MLIQVGDERCALPVGCVREVGRLPVVTRVPGLPAVLLGIVTWRGRVLPVLDLATALGASSPPAEGEATRLVVLTDGVGLAVRQVDDVVDVDETTLAPIPSTAPASRARLVQGVAVLGAEPVAVLAQGLAAAARDALAGGPPEPVLTPGG